MTLSDPWAWCYKCYKSYYTLSAYWGHMLINHNIKRPTSSDVKEGVSE